MMSSVPCSTAYMSRCEFIFFQRLMLLVIITVNWNNQDLSMRLQALIFWMQNVLSMHIHVGMVVEMDVLADCIFLEQKNIVSIFSLRFCFRCVDSCLCGQLKQNCTSCSDPDVCNAELHLYFYHVSWSSLRMFVMSARAVMVAHLTLSFFFLVLWIILY